MKYSANYTEMNITDLYKEFFEILWEMNVTKDTSAYSSKGMFELALHNYTRIWKEINGRLMMKFEYSFMVNEISKALLKYFGNLSDDEI